MNLYKRRYRVVHATNEFRVLESLEGKCPTCGRRYLIKGNGALRRHGSGKCHTSDQLPIELVPAVLAIAELEEE